MARGVTGVASDLPTISFLTHRSKPERQTEEEAGERDEKKNHTKNNRRWPCPRTCPNQVSLLEVSCLCGIKPGHRNHCVCMCQAWCCFKNKLYTSYIHRAAATCKNELLRKCCKISNPHQTSVVYLLWLFFVIYILVISQFLSKIWILNQKLILHIRNPIKNRNAVYWSPDSEVITILTWVRSGALDLKLQIPESNFTVGSLCVAAAAAQSPYSWLQEENHLWSDHLSCSLYFEKCSTGTMTMPVIF